MSDSDAIMRGFMAFKREQHRTPGAPNQPSGDVLTFGQAADCDVRIDDEYVSSHHCRAWCDEQGRYWVEDLVSTNGTWLRRGYTESRVYGPTRVMPGDAIRIGRTVLPWTGQATQ